MRLALIGALALATLTRARAEGEAVPCGGYASRPLSGPEELGARAALERRLFDGDFGHCEYALRRACMDWEGGLPDAAQVGFEMASRFCDGRAVPERGIVASALAAGRYGDAYAAWERHASAGPADSSALAAYEPAVFGGLSLTPFPYHGPQAYRIEPAGRDPARAQRLSLVPGLGLAYAGQPAIALSHLGLSLAFGMVCLWSGERALFAPGRDQRRVAALDLGLVASLFFQRYYLGGMREARRQVELKNRRAGQAEVAARAAGIDPFAYPAGLP